MSNENERLIWIDCETTGLNEEKHELLEVACVITDSELQELCVYENAIWQPGTPASLAESCSPFIRKMHGQTAEGQKRSLFEDVMYFAPLEVDGVQKDLLRLFHFHGVEPLKGILSGSSVHFDRGFLKKNMPLLETFFYHRMFDVSALKTAAQMWNPELLPPPPKAHRALQDVRASIALAKVFKPIFENALTLRGLDRAIDGNG